MVWRVIRLTNKQVKLMLVIMQVNNLLKIKCYLMGPMEYLDGQYWRIDIKKKLQSTGITFFDPYFKPFINEIKEDEEARRNLKTWMANSEFDQVCERMKQVRSDDLRLCDLSDFGIIHLSPSIPTFGTMEELSWFTRCKKPTFVFVDGGKVKTPLWIMGMIPHKYIYNSMDEVVDVLLRIDSGEKVLDNGRWRLLRQEYR